VVDAAHAVVMVEDNGPGIAPARRTEVFKRFFRGDRQATPPASGPTGAGLGLAIVHEIVTLHGGTIVIEDALEQRDAGMRFVITLPLAA
jgi:signal transduction histidine kinase